MYKLASVIKGNLLPKNLEKVTPTKVNQKSGVKFFITESLDIQQQPKQSHISKDDSHRIKNLDKIIQAKMASNLNGHR